MSRRPSGEYEVDSGWTREVEDICERMRVNAVNLSEYHRKRYFNQKSYGKYFRIPVIILASVNATASVGLQQTGVSPTTVSGITCLLGMVIGIIGSIELYLNIQQSMEIELKQAKEFYTLAIDLYKTLKLNATERGENGISYMNKKYSHYVKLKEASNLHKHKIRHDVLTRIPLEVHESPNPSLEGEFQDQPRSLYASFPKLTSVFFHQVPERKVQTPPNTLDEVPL
jgi:hypothetical protein